MNVGRGLLAAGVLLWILLTSVGAALFFSRRISRELRKRGESFGLRSMRSLSCDEYARSDIYGALVGWMGCACATLALIRLLVRRIL
jgi:hypothetical protein